MRNPWRISFDETTEQIWAGDVGQNAKEEIDIIVKGGNYGWRKKEGKNCYNPAANCEEEGFIAPIWDYGRGQGDVSVTGGFVYRGKSLPSLTGKYIYGDYASGRIWALHVKEDKSVTNTLLIEKGGSISSFGVDANKEIYFCQHNTGKIMKLVVSK
jgi:glucose/arabinose dehydrogenase